MSSKLNSIFKKLIPVRVVLFVRKVTITLFYNFVVSVVYRLMNSAEYKNLKLKSYKFNTVGTNINLPHDVYIMNPQYISIGKNFYSLFNLRIEAWDRYQEQRFTPQIIIGDNVSFNSDCHVGCVDKVVIGDNVLIASKVYISDHSHGDIDFRSLNISPSKRDLTSKGPVIIEENVWIGEGACIMPGVTIGRNSIIGANAVVTKSIEPYSIAAGVPAKVIKQIKDIS